MTEVPAIAAPLRNFRGPSLEGRTVVVIGYRRSGRAAAALLAACGAVPRVTDAAPLDDLGIASGDVPGGTDWIGRSDPGVLAGADLVVASPGVPPRSPVLGAALAAGLPVTSELELGWWFTDAPTVAITGTNGKTTTTELVGAMGRAAGRATVVAGNVGTPLTSVAAERPDLVVLEVSSFQLFLCTDFRPDVACVLNLTPDHLDWHADTDEYARSKRRLFERQRPGDAAVLNLADPEIVRRFAGLPGRTWGFRERPAPERGTWIEHERVVFRGDTGTETLVSLADWGLAGVHNRENLLAAALCARLAGLSPDAIATAARSFRGLAHRMETVAVRAGVTWINDSKSTNPGSLAKALDPAVATILIAGGVTKGVDFAPLAEAVAAGTRLVLLIGEGADAMERAWSGRARCERCGDLETAVRRAAGEARPGERVLLSPGCASFDQFDNYVHRGDRFRDLVGRLTKDDGTEGGER